jgi:STAS-like domain of unknown function (DUF4325)
MVVLPMLPHAELTTSGSGAMGSRDRAIPLRMKIAADLDAGHKVEIDFFGTEATQSFVDELIGLLILDRGETVLSEVTFKNCSSTMQAIIRFVIGDRLQQYRSKRRSAH